MRLPTYRQLTVEQDAAINVPMTKACLVTGPPGTGKTVIALYRAELASKKGEDVSLLMFNRMLSYYTRCVASDLSIDSTVSTYHRWVSDFCWQKLRTKAPTKTKWEYDWDSIFRLMGQRGLEGRLMTNLIVDEAQDLPPAFFTLSQFLAGRVTVFADENQTVTETQSRLADIYQRLNLKPEEMIRLKKNFRNTREIAEFASVFRLTEDTEAELPTKVGDKPIVERHTSLESSLRTVVTYAKNNPGHSVGVFSFTTKTLDRVVHFLGRELPAEVSFQQYPQFETVKGKKRKKPVDFEADGGVFALNVQSAKGLEFDCVFVVGLEDLRVGADETKTTSRLYVASTRARERLYLHYVGDGAPPVLERIPKELAEWYQ